MASSGSFSSRVRSKREIACTISALLAKRSEPVQFGLDCSAIFAMGHLPFYQQVISFAKLGCIRADSRT